MKYKFGQETETKKEDTYEEDEDKKQAQDLTNENEKQHDEEKKIFLINESIRTLIADLDAREEDTTEQKNENKTQ